MDLRYTEAEQEFRHALRSWLVAALPEVGPEPRRDDWAARREYDTGWQQMLHDAGYAGINWPTEFGGRGATPTEHLIFLELDYNKVQNTRGMDITAVTTAKTDEEARELLRLLGMPFREN